MPSVWKRTGAKPGSKWKVTYTVAPGVQRTITGTTDFRVSEQIGAELEKGALLRHYGVIDPVVEKLAGYAKRPIDEFLIEYENYLDSKRNGAQHTMETLSLIESVVEACGWVILADIDGPRFTQDLGRVLAAGASARTANKRRQAVRGFTRWLVREGRLRIDPLGGVAAIRQRDDVRLRRRAMSDEEVGLLLAVTESRPKPRGKLTGLQRMWLYRVAVETGYRASELLSLTPRSFRLRDRHADLDARRSKRRQMDSQPVSARFCDDIAQWLALHDLDQPLWPTTKYHTARMLQADLQAAGIDPADTGEGVLDFHALRHTYITRLYRAGVSPKVMQRLARHSTIELTLGRYSHLSLSDPASAIDSLPAIPSTRQVPKTGT
jgi:site-specific recombinase XerC